MKSADSIANYPVSHDNGSMAVRATAIASFGDHIAEAVQQLFAPAQQS